MNKDKENILMEHVKSTDVVEALCKLKMTYSPKTGEVKYKFLGISERVKNGDVEIWCPFDEDNPEVGEWCGIWQYRKDERPYYNTVNRSLYLYKKRKNANKR